MIEKDFLVIAITSPGIVDNEATKIVDLLRKREADIVHIRKPDWDLDMTKNLLDKIPASYHGYIKIHDNFELLEKYKRLRGVHLNSRNPEFQNKGFKMSKSLHSLEELNKITDYEKFEYLTLSPIFDSISKKNYKGNFDLIELKKHIFNKRIVALGGVTPDQFDLLKKTGFAGAAMLGYFWN